MTRQKNGTRSIRTTPLVMLTRMTDPKKEGHEQLQRAREIVKRAQSRADLHGGPTEAIARGIYAVVRGVTQTSRQSTALSMPSSPRSEPRSSEDHARDGRM